MLLLRVMTILAMATAIRSASWIESGKAWYDTDGKKIDAHGGSIFQKDDVFYWIGFSVTQRKLDGHRTMSLNAVYGTNMAS